MSIEFLSDSCPTNCGITREVLADNPCLACECEWYAAIESEELDDWDQEEDFNNTKK